MRYSINFDSTDIAPARRAELIRDAGFDSAFIWWDAHDGLNRDRAQTVRAAGLTVESAHTDFHGINSIWLDNAEGDAMRDYLVSAVRGAEEIGIPTLIVHVSSSPTPPEFNSLGLSRFLDVIREAEKLGVKLAFENLRRTQYLDRLFENTDSPAALFCFDIGHEHIYNGGAGVLEKYCSRIAAFHIHDNHGDSDEHLLPFDGSIDWHVAASRIKPYMNRLPFTLEAYAPADDGFYREAMARARRITAMM